MPAPTVSIFIQITDIGIMSGSTPVFFSFNQVVTGVGNAAVTVQNGTLSNITDFNGGFTYMATFTPNAGVSDSTNVITFDLSTVTAASDGTPGVGVFTSGNYAIDLIAPTLAITNSDPLVTADETSILTFSFSEPVTGFSTGNLFVNHGFVGAASTSDGGMTYTATYTPEPNYAGAVIIQEGRGGYQDGAGNVGATDTQISIDVDAVRPTVSVGVSDNALSIGETSTVTFTFSQAVSGFDVNDIIGGGGGTFLPVQQTGPTTYTATFIPFSNFTGSASNFAVNMGGVTAVSNGNAGAGQTTVPTLAIDTQRPDVSISLGDAVVGGSHPTTPVTFTFTEAVSGFDNSDVTVENGALSGLSSSDGGITWTGTFTPNAGVSDTTNVITVSKTGVMDLAGNAGTGTATSGNYAVDTVAPTLTITVGSNLLLAGQTTSITFAFSEAVTGFPPNPAFLIVDAGTISGLSSSDGGVTYTGTFTPSPNRPFDPTNLVQVGVAPIHDLAGNTVQGGTIASNNYGVDTTRPTATVTLGDSHLASGESTTVTVAFDDFVNGFSNANVTASNGALSTFTTNNGGQLWQATFTPTPGANSNSNVIDVDLSSLSDNRGNLGLGHTQSANYQLDSIAPTAIVSLSDSTLSIGETATVTVVFSEAVTGSINATAAGGTLGAFSSIDGITYTTTFTPTAAMNAPANVLSLITGGITDTAGNPVLGPVQSANYVVDTVRPTATLALDHTTFNGGETAQLTVTFSEPVTGFTNADLTVQDGTLSALNSTDSGVTWTATFTPGVAFNSNDHITLANTGVTDLHGNAGAGATTSTAYNVLTDPPPDDPPPPVAGGGGGGGTPTIPFALTVDFTAGQVSMTGAVGDDIVTANALNNMVTGGDGNDSVAGGGGGDTIGGDAGNDSLQGNTGNDTLSGGAGNDVLFGGQDSDMVQGGVGNDYVSGDKGDDIVRGGQGDDIVSGGDGNDFVSGDLGSDTLTGGAGADIFHSFSGAGMDLVTDFHLSEGDRIELDPGTVYTLAQVGADTVITMNGGQLVLVGVQLSSLTPGWIFGA